MDIQVHVVINLWFVPNLAYLFFFFLISFHLFFPFGILVVFIFRLMHLEELSMFILFGLNKQMQVTTGRYHTLLIRDSSVYSCGSSLCGVLGHGAETTQCVAFTRIRFPSLAYVIQVSASHNHAAFVLQSGEVCYWSHFIFHQSFVLLWTNC
jgi:hypothetical protein